MPYIHPSFYTVYNFSAFPESLFTLFRIILGDFDFHELEQANYILGPIFFITYWFVGLFWLQACTDIVTM